MPFTKVKPGEDPKKVLEELIAIKQRIRKRNIEQDFQEAVSEENVKKMFKPVTASLAEATAKATKEAAQSVVLPRAEQASIMPPSEQPEGLPEFLNPIVTSVFASAYGDDDLDTNRRRPIPVSNDTINLNQVPLKIVRYQDAGERLEIRESESESPQFSAPLTRGLMELLVRKKHYEAASEEDKANYVNLLDKVGLLRNPSGALKGDSSKKYKKVIKPTFTNHDFFKKPKRGTGVTRGHGGVHIIVGDIDHLFEQLELDLASVIAGNTSKILRNKIVTIANYLFKKNKISKDKYNKIILDVSA